MCIIIYSQPGVGYPTKETMEYCWEKNPDGAGYAYLTVNDTWSVKKGFMDKDEFFVEFEKEEFEPGNTVILHFRIGTSGTWDGACTHPFPIADTYDELTQLNYEVEDIVFHNGIHGDGEGDWSDTMIAIRDLVVPLYPLIEDEKIYNIMKLILKAGDSYGSRWIFGKGDSVHLMGKWIKEEETGLLYSKDDWIRPVFVKERESRWYGWGDVHPSFKGGVYNASDNSRALTVINRERKPDIIYQTGIWASTFEGKNGNWSWKEWATFKETDWEDDEDNQAEHLLTKAEADPQDVIEIFDTNNKVVALLDRNGETIWDQDNGGHKEQLTRGTIKACPKCNADLFASDFDEDGDCPWCGTPIFINEGEKLYQCPSCQEENYLIDSTFSSGDSECLRCGALFLDTITGIDSIVGWNMDTATNHSQMIKTMMREGSE